MLVLLDVALYSSSPLKHCVHIPEMLLHSIPLSGGHPLLKVSIKGVN